MTKKKVLSKCFKALRRAGMSVSDAGFVSKKLVKGCLWADVKDRFLCIDGMSAKFDDPADWNGDRFGFVDCTFFYKGVSLDSFRPNE